MLPSLFQLLQRIQHPSRLGRIHQLQLGVLVSLILILRQVALALRLAVLSHAGSWKDITAAQFFLHGFDYVVFGVLLVGAGMYLIYKADAPTPEPEGESIKDLIKCVEAAAAGDLGRRPSDTATGDVGQLAQAVGRLIEVLNRSKNQIYHLATLVENSSDAVISHTIEGTIITWNKGAQRIYGYAAKEVEGKPITLLSPMDQGAEIQRQLDSIRQGNRPQPFETLQRARNGRNVKALVQISPILDSTRQVIGISFCAQEMTDARLPAPADNLSPTPVARPEDSARSLD